MKVISLIQPWASLIVMGAKKFETRSWNTQHRGRILIHASVKKSEENCSLCMTQPFYKYINGIRGYYDLPYGAIIGEAMLESTQSTESIRQSLQGTDEIHFGDYSTGRMAWKMVKPVQYRIVTPARGQLSVWEFPETDLRHLKTYLS